jgi:hypothetical protein
MEFIKENNSRCCGPFMSRHSDRIIVIRKEYTEKLFLPNKENFASLFKHFFLPKAKINNNVSIGKKQNEKKLSYKK